jgi:transcriptional regulator
MYLPSHFNEPRRAALEALMREHPLGTLISSGAGGLTADHLPFLFDAGVGPMGQLRAHVARANPLWREVAPDAECLVVFQGPAAYVSPSWHPRKKTTHKVVPTYNYSVVHARGCMRMVEDRGWLRQLVDELTQRFEAGRPEAWQVSDAPADFIETMLGAIVGIEIEVRELVGKFKLSQNHTVAERQGLIAGLKQQPDVASHAVADAMRPEQTE